MTNTDYSTELNDRSITKDHSRPFYQRKKGEIGIYICIYEAKPVDHTEYGSKHFYEQNMTEILYKEWSKISLDLIKGQFERSNLLEDVVLEEFTPGIIMGISFNQPEALEILWKLYQNEQFCEIQHILEKVLVTPELLAQLSASCIDIRTRIWEDEYEECLKELHTKSSRVPIRQMECCTNMLRMAKIDQYLIADKFLIFKDDLSSFEHHLNEFTVLIRNFVPITIQNIESHDEFLEISKELRKQTTAEKMKPLDLYMKMKIDLSEIISHIEVGICHRLAQVHRKIETTSQNELRRRIIERRTELEKRLESDYKLTKMNHPEARRRVLVREHGLFLGIVSLLYIGLDLALEFDQQFDEYMSGYVSFPH